VGITDLKDPHLFIPLQKSIFPQEEAFFLWHGTLQQLQVLAFGKGLSESCAKYHKYHFFTKLGQYNFWCLFSV
jgi:hypothetical protein